MPEVHCAHVGPSGGGQCTDDVPFTPGKADKVIPPLTIFYAPPLLASFIRGQVPLA
jgi:hypothetical protein